MVSIRSVLRTIPDPRGKKGRLHRLDAILSLILLSMLSGRKGMKAAFHPGRGLSRKHLDRLGFRRDRKSVTSRTVVWVFVEQFWFEFVPVFHCLQGRLAAQG